MALSHKKPTLLPTTYEAERRLAERAVLCALLTNKRAVPDILSELLPNDFKTEDYRDVFVVVVELFEKQKPIDLVTVSLEFHKRNHKGDLSIADLFDKEFSGDYLVHVKIIKELLRRQRLQQVLLNAAEKIKGTAEVDEVIADLTAELSQSVHETIRRPVLLETAVTASMKRIDKAIAKKSTLTGIPTGYIDFDRKIGGLQPGELIIVGARPSIGKSALLAGIALGAARLGYPSLIVNAEMELIEVGTRMLAGASGVENFDLRRGKVDDYEIPKIVAGAAKLRLPIWIYDDTRWEVIKAQARALKMQRQDLSLILIDYVTRIKVERQQDEKRWEQIGRVAKESKDLGKELGVAVVLAAQLSRVVAKENKEPDLVDLRESGDLEQDADMVTFLHRYDSKMPWKVYWLVKKNRNGPLGSICLNFRAPDVAFYNWEGGTNGED